MIQPTPPREQVLLRTRPGALFVILYRPAWLIPSVLALAACFVVVWLPDGLRPAGLAAGLFWFSVLWALMYLLWGVLEWLSRRYELTTERITVEAGVVARVAADVPLRSVQHVTGSQSVLERLAGLGTVGVATAGADGAAVHWLMIPRSGDAMSRIRAEVERASRTGGSTLTHSPAHPLTPSPLHAPARPSVVGLAGGIGSGKSEVARILEKLGCVVTDSDAEARRVLDSSDVKPRLVEWWGPRVLGADGRVDRSAIAKIVFADPAQRERLEGLVHPLVKASRAVVIRAAVGRGARAAVIDAPLLFEAGVDKECDAVIFVDAPRALRLQRVREMRGWDEGELDRREAAQMPLEEKRRRSQEVVVNEGGREDLERAVSAALDRILERSARRTDGVA